MKRLFSWMVMALALLCAMPAFATTASGQLTNGRQQFLNASGAPLANGSVFVYLPNTTTPVTTYQDAGLSTANTFPIVLDSNGMASIWVPPGQYREIVIDANGVTLFDQTTSSTGYASALNPGATIAASGDITCTATQFTGSSNITLPCAFGVNAIANSKLAQMNANTIKGNNTNSSATPSDLTVSQVAAMLPGQATSWAQIQGSTTGTCTVIAGYNVASCARVSAGYYTVTFSAAMADSHYAQIGMAYCSGTNCAVTNPAVYGAVAPSTGSFEVHVQASNSTTGSTLDPDLLYVATFGN